MSERTAVIPFHSDAPMENLVGGFTWVTWLLQSVRARCRRLHFHGGHRHGTEINERWECFGQQQFVPHIGPLLADAWTAAAERKLESLVTLDRSLQTKLTPAAASRSREAGAMLLRTTRGARYQGMLGHYRAKVDAGAAHGHFLIVWAAVGHFFQLSLANVLAEYLRLEWTMGTRHLPGLDEPAETFSRFASAALASISAYPRIEMLRAASE